MFPNTTVTVIPMHKSIIGNPQTNRIVNGKHSRGAHNQWTDPNDLNYGLGLP